MKRDCVSSRVVLYERLASLFHTLVVREPFDGATFLEEFFALFVAASTRCFPDVQFFKSLQKLAELDFRSAEIVVGRAQSDLQPEWLEEDFHKIVRMCLAHRQITPDAIYLALPPSDPQYKATFERCVRFCQALRTVTLVVKASPAGSPFNEEFERLSALSSLGIGSGVVVSVLTESDAISGAVDALASLCNSLPSLSVALDPSHFIFGRKTPINYDSIISRVSHVRLRNTTEKQFQVQIGQGSLEYGKLVAQLTKANYRRALCVDLAPLPDVNPESELRKMRLLVESWI